MADDYREPTVDAAIALLGKLAGDGKISPDDHGKILDVIENLVDQAQRWRLDVIRISRHNTELTHEVNDQWTQILLLRERVDLHDRKISHGCIDAACDICDP